jgi:hypothetical protein
MSWLHILASLLAFVSSSEPAVTPPVDEERVLVIEVRPVEADAEPVDRKHPPHYEGFEKRIEEFKGKAVLDILGNRLSIQLLNNSRRMRPEKPEFGAADFICAVLRGQIVPMEEMRYHLQDAQECLVTTPDGDYRVGIY